MDYYDFFPVLSLKETYLTSLLKMVKAYCFVFVSCYSGYFVLWLLAILIKLESKAPFFKQGRPGINENEFHCYKFRSMK
jgi:putative colanic acid biosynthesis UDP-glucose lipid carrier transferase